MILLGTNGHDSSCINLEKTGISYLKLERYYQIKHFGQRYRGIADNKDFYLSIKDLSPDSFFRKFIPFKGNFFYLQIPHHLKHAYSIELFESCDIHVVIDGQDGTSDPKWYSIYRDDTLIASGSIKDCGGTLGHIWYKDIKGDSLDAPGKIMGLQSYGNFNETYYEELKRWNCDYLGDYMNSSMFSALYAKNLSTESFERLHNQIKHIPYLYENKDLKGQSSLDYLHTLHRRAGEIVLEIFQRWVKPNEKVGYSGGVAQNVVWNTMLKQHYPNLTIYPHCGDEGLCLGVLHSLNKKYERSKLTVQNYPYCQKDQAPDTNPSIDTIYKTAKFLAEGKIVAWYQGHGEIGPRALGNRSILMDPRISNGKDIINRVKNREYYRPFGSSVLYEYAKEYFDLDYENPYMLYLGHTQKDNLDAITHVDGTSRAQTVASSCGHFRLLLEQFFELTGCPVLLNTSLNEAGKPIAGWIKNAETLFISTPIDILVVGDKIYVK